MKQGWTSAVFAAVLAVAGAGGLAAQDVKWDMDYKGKLSAKTIDSKNDMFAFNMETRFQARLEVVDGFNRTTDARGHVNLDDNATFGIRRLKTNMSGYVFQKEFTYNVTFAWRTTNVAEMIEDCAFVWTPSKPANIGFGKRKVPFNLQELTSSGRQQLVDRSEVNGQFSHGFGHGAWFTGAPSLGEGDSMTVQYTAGIFNGMVRSPTDFRSNDLATAPVNEDFTFLYAGRVELYPMGGLGTVDRYESDLRKPEEAKFLMLFGLAGNYFVDRQDKSETTDRGTTLDPEGLDLQARVFTLTADIRVHASGFSLNGAIIHRTVVFDDSDDIDNVDPNTSHPNGLTDIAGFIQAGYNIYINGNESVEVAARYGVSDFDEFQDRVGDNETGPRKAITRDRYEYTVGGNYYIRKEKLKLTADIGYITDKEVIGAADGAKEIAFWRFRFQIQVVF